MTVRDLLPMNIDIDVCDDVCEELYIAFCGPQELTDEGMKEFTDVLDYPIEFNGGIVIVYIDDDDDSVWEQRLARAKLFFHGMAGYIDNELWHKWFKEDD